MEKIERPGNGSRIIGAFLILIGVVYFLHATNIIELSLFGSILQHPFALVMVLVGTMILINSDNKLFGGIIASLGIFFIAKDELGFDGHVFWPVIIIAVGVYILLKKNTHPKACNGKTHFPHEFQKDIIDDVAIFGGGSRNIKSDNFKGGDIVAIFGGSEIDLTQCKLAEGENILDVVLLFGGTELIVPRDWDIRMQVTPIFGGFSNKKFRGYDTVDNTRWLVIKGVAMFGGGEIKSY